MVDRVGLRAAPSTGLVAIFVALWHIHPYRYRYISMYSLDSIQLTYVQMRAFTTVSPSISSNGEDCTARWSSCLLWFAGHEDLLPFVLNLLLTNII
jgi:hypothetical protein